MSSPTLKREVDPRDRTAAPLRLETALLSSTDEFASLEPEWNALVQRSAFPNVFLTWEWLWTWWEVFGGGLRPMVLVTRDVESGRIIGIAPFVLRRLPFAAGPCRELSLMGTLTAAGDHFDVISQAGCENAVATSFHEVLQSHSREWDLLALDRISSRSRFFALLQLQGQNGRPKMVWESVCPYLRLPGRWDELMSRLTKNTRRNLRKCANRLARETAGGVEYRPIRAAEDVPAALDSLFRLHSALWNARGERGAFHCGQVRQFHRQVAERLATRDRLRMYLLQVQGQTVASEYAFRYDDTMYMYQGGYDPAWADRSPGTALMEYAVRSSMEEGVHEVDFLRGEEPYKAHWTHTARVDFRMRLATTRLGALVVRAYQALYAARRKYRNWRGVQGSAPRFVEMKDSPHDEGVCLEGEV